MKKNDKNTLKSMNPEGLKKEIREVREKLVRMKLERYTKQVKNVREGKEVRRRLALLETIVRQKELTHE